MLACISRNAEARLKKWIKGEVKCFTRGDLIICDIKTRYFSYRVTVEYTRQDILTGRASTDNTVGIIIQAYKNYIKKKFFEQY